MLGKNRFAPASETVAKASRNSNRFDTTGVSAPVLPSRSTSRRPVNKVSKQNGTQQSAGLHQGWTGSLNQSTPSEIKLIYRVRTGFLWCIFPWFSRTFRGVFRDFPGLFVVCFPWFSRTIRGVFSMTFQDLAQWVEVLVFNTVNANYAARCYRTL